MATRVIISTPLHNHEDVLIEVKNNAEAVLITHRLTDGQHKELFVYGGQYLTISEVAKEEKNGK